MGDKNRTPTSGCSPCLTIPSNKKEYPSYKRKPNRYEVTLKKGGILGAICFGQISTPIRPSVLSQRALPILSHVSAVFSQHPKRNYFMKPDPRTEEGVEEIKRRLRKLNYDHDDVVKRSKTDVDEEPSGAMTTPSELDVRRDRNHKKE
ncbi:MAG: hypothetical protein JKY50_18230 [Oleispira sp.]|nr:hypothetical protein [Oleispira sp.]